MAAAAVAAPAAVPPHGLDGTHYPAGSRPPLEPMGPPGQPQTGLLAGPKQVISRSLDGPPLDPADDEAVAAALEMAVCSPLKDASADSGQSSGLPQQKSKRQLTNAAAQAAAQVGDLRAVLPVPAVRALALGGM